MPVIILLSVLLNLILAVFVFVKRKNKIQKSFSLLILIIVIWLLFNFLYFLKPVYPYIHMAYGFGAVVVAAIFYWIVIFTKSQIPKIYNYLVIPLTFLLAFVAVIPNHLLKTNLEPILFGYNSEKGPWFIAFSVIETLILLGSSFLLIRFYKKTQGLQRLQTTYVMLGFVVPIFFVVLFDFILPIFNLNWLDIFDNLTSLLFVGFISYAITRHRLFGMGIVIRKSAIQIATFAILFGLYAYILLFIQRASSGSVQLSDNATLLVTILLIAITIEPLRRFIYKWIDNLFESKERNRKEALERLKLLSASNAQYENLISHATLEFSKSVEVENIEFCLYQKKHEEIVGRIALQQTSPTFQLLKSGKLLVRDEIVFRVESGEENLQQVCDWMKEHNISVLLPVGKNEEFLGVFVVPEEKGQIFTKEKIEFMKSFATQLQLALASSLAYKYAIERIKI
jgi:hypothetical protein